MSSPKESTGRSRRPAILGRRFGVAMFWAMAVYVVGAAALSIIPQLYFPLHAPSPHDSSALACPAAHRDLLDELLAHTAKGLSIDTDRSAWLSRWDARLGDLETHCRELGDTRREMRKLRTGVVELLDKHHREHRPLHARIRAVLDALPHHGHSDPET